MTPRRSLEGLLAAAELLGLDAAPARQAAFGEGLGPDELVPPAAEAAAFAALAAQRPDPALPTELGLAAPLGAFGVVDYLAGSSATIEGALEALSAHFAHISRSVRLSLVRAPGQVVLEARGGVPVREEVTLAVTIGRFRRLAVGEFRLAGVTLRSRSAGPSRHAEVLGCPVTLGADTSSFRLSEAVAALPLATSDANLVSALAPIIAQLSLGPEDAPPLAVAVRSRLRDLLPSGRCDASSVARTLGMSERTLHRKLAQLGEPFQELLDAFREGESERLLRAGMPQAEVALALGYSDQSAWSRAFKRWKGESPRAWLASRAAGR